MTLEVVHDAALALASEQAEAIRRAAHEHAEEIAAAARAEAADAVARRRAAAVRLADFEQRELLAQARSRARATLLHARHSVLTEAAAAAHAATGQMVEDPRYRRLLDRLAAEAQERLAAAGPVQIRTAAGGGFMALAGTRGIDYSLHAQVDRCLRMLASEIERLWR